MLQLQPRRPLPGRRVLLTIFLNLLLPATWLSAQIETKSATLAPDQTAYFHLPPRSSLALTFDLGACHDAEILVETSSAGANFVLLGPNDQPLGQRNAEHPGWFALWIPCAHRGLYRLVAQAALPDGRSGVSLHVEYLPFASAAGIRRRQAVALFTAARSLAGSPHAAPLRAAVEQYRQATAAWGAAGDRDGQVLALGGEAQAWLNLSEYDQALAALRRARFLRPSQPFLEAWLANLTSQVYLDRWDSDMAMRSAKEATRISSGLADPWLRADALASRAEAEFLTDDREDTADVKQALTLSGESDAAETMARALRCQSWIASDQGQVTGAMGWMRQAEERFRAQGEIRSATDAMANLATLRGMDGDHYAALVNHAKLTPLIRASGKLADLAFLLMNTANDYLQLNRVPDAIAYYQEAIATFRKIGLVPGYLIGTSQLCLAEERSGELHAALRDCSEAKAVTERLHDPKRLATAIWRLGVVQRALGNTAQAIASFRQASEISERIHDPHAQAQSLMDWGDTLESLGQRQQAREKFAMALPLSQEAEDVPEQIEARYRMARSAFEAGKDEEAKSELNRALAITNIQRRAIGNPGLQAAYFAQLHKCHELSIDLLMREQQRDGFGVEQALEVSEAGRALTLLDTLSARSRTSASQSPGRPRAMLEMQTAVERAYEERLKLIFESAGKRALEANEARLTRAMDTLGRSEDELRAAAAFDVAAGAPLKAEEIKAASRVLDYTLVEYSLGDNDSYVWVIDRGQIKGYVLPPRKVIESAVKHWRTLATARIPRPGESFAQTRRRVQAADAELPRVAAGLSGMLLAFLQPHMERFAIVPDGELNLLPFAALPEKGSNGCLQPLSVGRQTVVVPSLSVLLLPHRAPDYGSDYGSNYGSNYGSWMGEIAVLADPVFDAGDPRLLRSAGAIGNDHGGKLAPALPRLYASGDEARAVAALVGGDRSALYLDFDANLQTLMDPSLSQYRILHIATHGILDENAPGLSGIVLSLVNREGKPIFGYLKGHDVESLSLHFDLVVLSSCDSGSGPNLSGEGITGLNHAFLSAGAARVLSTLWSVEDRSSQDLMTAFYSALLHEGIEPAEALRRSQIKLMRNPTTSAPYYWAGFSLTSTLPD